MKDNSCILAASVQRTTAATFNGAWLDLQNTDNSVPMRAALHLTEGAAVGSDVTVNFYLEHSADGATSDGIIAAPFDFPAAVASAANLFTITSGTSSAAGTATGIPAAYNMVFATPYQYIRLVTIVAGGSGSRSITYEAYISPTAVGEI